MKFIDTAAACEAAYKALSLKLERAHETTTALGRAETVLKREQERLLVEEGAKLGTNERTVKAAIAQRTVALEDKVLDATEADRKAKHEVELARNALSTVKRYHELQLAQLGMQPPRAGAA